MAAQNGRDGPETRWEGYSDYKTVSITVGQTIEGAVEAYAQIESRHAEAAPVEPELAAEARARIKSAAMKLLPELRNDKDTVELYKEILDDWEGEDGHIQELNRIQLQHDCPPWLYEMVVQIRQAGWELGYLKAGRSAKQTPDDPEEAARQETRSMFTE